MRLFLLALLITALNGSVISKSKLQELSKNPTWLKLLHYKDGKSSIIDKHFFLDKQGNLSSEKELEATIKAYYKPFNPITQHARCRYPARYYWLSKQIPLANYTTIPPQCKQLKKWSLLHNTQSISVIFVSGYLGNPASAFGHSFIKVNQSEDTSDNLFDTSISYGALLPQEYTMPEYIINGLFGGYSAAYSDRYYYHQDMTYSNEEYRDMWEYRLNLGDEQKKFFLLHAWELMGKKFQYFFLNRNCGYKVSELLELVYDKKIIKSASIWYAPIETFYRLRELEKRHGKIVKKVHYIPSKQQQIYRHYQSLNTIEKEMTQELIEHNLTAIPSHFIHATPKEKGNALDFVLSYKKYTHPKESQKALLLSRLKFPMRKEPIPQPSKRVDITQYNKPNYLGLTLTQDGLNLNWSPFALEKTGYNSLDGDELVVFDTKVKIDKRVKLSQFDLICIRKLKTKQLPFDNTNPLSWNIHIGTNHLNEHDYFSKAGAGFAWQPFNRTKLFSMVNLSIHSNQAKYRATPHIGMFNNFNKLRLSTIVGYEYNLLKDTSQQVVDFNGQYKIGKEFSFVLNYHKQQKENLEVGIQWFY